MPPKSSTRYIDELDSMSEELGEMIANDVTDIVGVLVGLKQAAFIGGNRQNISVDLLERLGLAHVSWEEKSLTYISFRQDMAKRLATVHRKVWGNNREHAAENREIGKLLGYPETATEYFLKRLQALESGDPATLYIPEETMGTVSEYFQNLILSPEHYKEELATYCRPLEEAVRAYAPKTYAFFCTLNERSKEG